MDSGSDVEDRASCQDTVVTCIFDGNMKSLPLDDMFIAHHYDLKHETRQQKWLGYQDGVEPKGMVRPLTYHFRQSYSDLLGKALKNKNHLTQSLRNEGWRSMFTPYVCRNPKYHHQSSQATTFQDDACSHHYRRWQLTVQLWKSKMETLHQGTKRLRVLRWALHWWFTMESFEQKCERDHCTQHQNESIAVLGAMERVRYMFATCSHFACHGFVGTPTWMWLLEWWKNEINDWWYTVHSTRLRRMHVWVDFEVQRRRDAHKEALESRVMGGTFLWLAWKNVMALTLTVNVRAGRHVLHKCTQIRLFRSILRGITNQMLINNVYGKKFRPKVMEEEDYPGFRSCPCMIVNDHQDELMQKIRLDQLFHQLHQTARRWEGEAKVDPASWDSWRRSGSRSR